MITKYQMISIMAEETAREIAKNEQAWTRYLTTAARLYKYPFNEQMLIYAQRPDASACASLETWNEKMNCWVNRGAKGIALIDTESERPRLKYVFDVSDVHKARRIGRDPYLCEFQEEHKNAVIRQNGKIIKEIDLNAVTDPYEFEIKTSDGQHSNTIRVEQGKIAIIDADCADKICVNTGYISDSVIPIVCLPHRLSITIVDKESDFDAIAGNK